MSNALAAEVDCSEAYGKPSKCIKIACHEKYQSFLGTWEGPFKVFDQSIGDFRPYSNKISYSEKDCLKNIETSDEFIVGRRIDIYPAYKGLPAKIDEGLLITGRLKGQANQPFLRTVSYHCKGAIERIDNYELVFSNAAAETSVWQLKFPASSGTPEKLIRCEDGKQVKIPTSGPNPDMIFTTIDGRDMTVLGTHKRFVTVTLSLPGWEGPIVIGYHAKPE